jgi:pimeloyl-ACP methyl ester carboxylesterase
VREVLGARLRWAWYDAQVRESFVRVNGVRLHLVAEGPESGPLALLLHGFPQFWYGWRHQIQALAARGLRVVAPDLRGYNLSDKPGGVAPYDLDELARDVAELIPALGRERAAVVGHDWGALIAWHVAVQHPACVEKLVSIDGAPIQVLLRAIATSPRQLARSWYTVAFQLPALPERLLSTRLVRRWILGWTGRAGTFSGYDEARFIEAAARPGAMRAAINYYRAALRRWPEWVRAAPTPVAAPTQVIWGADDRVLGAELARSLERWVNAPLEVHVLDGVGHFAPEEAPWEVNRLLAAFLG